MAADNEGGGESAAGAGAERPSVDTTLRIFIEMFSVVTALSFVAAAALLYCVFFIWNLDFFALATVADVVMGGVYFLLAIIFVAVCTFAVFFVIAALKVREQALVVLVLVLLTAAFSLLHVIAYFELIPALSNDEVARFFRGGMVIVAALLAAYAATVRAESSRNIIRHFARNWRNFAKVSGTLLAISVPIGILYFANYGFGRTYLVDKDRVGCPTERAQLMWMGSSSVVFRCDDRFRAIIGYEDLLLRSPEPPRNAGQEQPEDYLDTGQL